MASQTTFTDAGGTARAIHEEQELCKYLLRAIHTTTPLHILPSKIHPNGTGLFAKEAIAVGKEVFRSKPLVSCVMNELYNVTCDYCLTSSKSKINHAGYFRTKDDVMPQIKLCAQCRVCGYCSKVRELAHYLLV
jgi:SET and MYND domain-containing protein